MRKFLVVFAAVLSPLSAQAISFGPETPVAPVAHAIAYGWQETPSVACNGQSCLALWTDFDFHRLGLYTSVINADGTVQPASSNPIRPGFQLNPSLVWTGDHYLAVWTDDQTRALVAAPLSRDGVMTGDVQALTSSPESVTPNSLAWNGHHAFAAFLTPGGLHGAIADADGHLVRSVVVPTSQPTAYAVAAAGQTFAVVWCGTTNVYLQRFDDNGTPFAGDPITLATNVAVKEPRIGMASNGTQFGVAFVASDSGMIQRLRVDAVSGAIDRFPLTSFNRQLAGVFWSGDDFIAYAPDLYNIDTEQFTFDAVRVLNVSSRGIDAPQVVEGPSGAVAVWRESQPSGADRHVVGAMFDRDGTAVAQRDVTVARSAVPQTHPALALSPAGALLVWQADANEEHADILATPLDPSGKPVKAVPLLLATDVESHASRSVLWLGNFYLVVWPHGGSILGKRVSASGAVLDQDPLVFGKGSAAALATNGTITVLVLANTDFARVGVVRLNAAGGVIDSQPVAITSHLASSLTAASNGDEFVIAWTEEIGDNVIGFQGDVYAVRLGATGLPIDASPIGIANTGRNEVSPAAASDGRDFLIAYSDDVNLGMKRLLREGTVVDAGTIEGGAATAAHIAFDGSRYVLTWSDLVQLDSTSVAAVARAAAVDASGAIVDPPVVVAQDDSLFPPETAVVPGLLAYSRANGGDAGIPRMFVRQIFAPVIRGRAVRH